MIHGERDPPAVTPAWFFVAVSGFFVAFGVVHAVLLLRSGTSGTAAAIDFTLVAGPGIALLYGTYRLTGSSLERSVYPRIAVWTAGGIVMMLGIAGLLSFNPAGDLDQPFRAAVIGAGIGANGGFLVGTNEAQSIARAREAERRNRELERTNRELEETKAELGETVTRLERSNERLEQFAYAASHDLQEPLRMVSSYLRLVNNRYADALDEEGREFVAFAVDGADRMRDMIDGLLEYSRVQTGGDPFEPVDLEAVLEDVREDLQVRIEETDAEVTAESLPTVRGDESQLRQVLQNLLENAIKYSGEEPPQVHVSADRAGDERVIAVADEGVGIDPDHHEQVFQVFKQLHGGEEQSGTGIGLALCKRIVERHDGEMWIESVPGEGATFYFTLPDVDDERREPPAPESRPLAQ